MFQGTYKSKLEGLVGEVQEHEKVAIARRRSGLSQYDIFAKTQVHPQDLSLYENGKRRLAAEKIQKVVECLYEEKNQKKASSNEERLS